MITNLIKIGKQILGSSILLPVHERVWQTQHPFWWRISQNEIRKIAAAKKEAAKARAGKKLVLSVAEWILSPQPPSPAPEQVRYGTSLFARPSGKVFIKIRSPDFRQKKLEFQPKGAANFQIATFGRLLPRPAKGGARLRQEF